MPPLPPPGKIHLYGARLSQPTRSNLLLCEHAGVDYKFHALDLAALEHKREPYLSMNPNGTIPALKDEGFVLVEGAAMLVYIAETRPEAASFYPPGAQVRARIHRWLNWHQTATRLSTRHYLVPMLFGTPKVEGGDASFAASLAVLDKELAVSPTGFVAWTDGPSVADLLLLPEIDQLTEECFDYFDLSPYASIQAWLGKMRAALPEAYPANFAVATDFAKSR